MKTKLNKDESQHLIDLGVSKEKASDIEEYSDPISQWTHRGAPIFTLTNLLEILPKFVGQSTLDIHILVSGEWQAMYYAYHPSSKIAHEFIDALYELACWYYGEYLKQEVK